MEYPPPDGDRVANHEDALDDLAFLVRSENRVRILDALATEPATRRALADATDVSRTTLDRIVNELEDREWVERRADGQYAATPIGRHVHEALQPALDGVVAVRRLGRALDWLPRDEHPIGLEHFSDAHVRHPDGADPVETSRYYEALDRDALPEDLLVVGDAIASFNPIYGQGMSVAALEALALHRALATGGRRALDARFFEQQKPVVDHAWKMAVGADAPFAPDDAPIPRRVRLFTAYFDRAMRAGQTDGELRDALMRVLSMQDPPTALLRPGVARRVLAPSDVDGTRLLESAAERVSRGANAVSARSR